jgi:transposase
VNDAAWAQLVAVIGYKAVNAGGAIVHVDPHTSGMPRMIRPNVLKDRWRRCDCGAEMHRHIASAKVVQSFQI